MEFDKENDPPKYYETLDRLRNAHDRLLKRGYDYDGAPRYVERVSEHVEFVMVGDCAGCGQPAGITLPDGKRYCGPCLRETADYKAKQKAREERHSASYTTSDSD